MPSDVEIRFAEEADFDRLAEIEASADTLLVDLFSAVNWPAATPADERAAYPGFTLLLRLDSAKIIGFAQVIEIDGLAHLEQLCVLPDHGRKGYGRMLVTATKTEARRRGHSALTLRTYRDVAWNAPFYATCGFVPSFPTSDFHRRLIDVETGLRLERWGPRIQMTTV